MPSGRFRAAWSCCFKRMSSWRCRGLGLRRFGVTRMAFRRALWQRCYYYLPSWCDTNATLRGDVNRPFGDDVMRPFGDDVMRPRTMIPCAPSAQYHATVDHCGALAAAQRNRFVAHSFTRHCQLVAVSVISRWGRAVVMVCRALGHAGRPVRRGFTRCVHRCVHGPPCLVRVSTAVHMRQVAGCMLQVAGCMLQIACASSWRICCLRNRQHSSGMQQATCDKWPCDRQHGTWRLAQMACCIQRTSWRTNAQQCTQCFVWGHSVVMCNMRHVVCFAGSSRPSSWDRMQLYNIPNGGAGLSDAGFTR